MCVCVCLSVTTLAATLYILGLYIENKGPLSFLWHFLRACVDYGAPSLSLSLMTCSLPLLTLQAEHHRTIAEALMSPRLVCVQFKPALYAQTYSLEVFERSDFCHFHVLNT